jgi:hypothetical protein
LAGEGIDQQLERAGLAAAGRTAQQCVMAQIVDLDADGQDGIGVADCPAVPTLVHTGLCTQAGKPAGATAFFGCERTLASGCAPEQPWIVDSKVDVEERHHEGQHDEEAQGVSGWVGCTSVVLSQVVSRGWRELRASHAGSKSAGDRCARFVGRNAESGGDIEQHRFDIAVGQCFGGDEASETERGEVESGVALTYCVRRSCCSSEASAAEA